MVDSDTFRFGLYYLLLVVGHKALSVFGWVGTTIDSAAPDSYSFGPSLGGE